MSDPLSIALSGLRSASTKAGAAASNIANVSTSGAREGADGPEAYQPVDVVETSFAAESGEPHGVKAEVVPRKPATTPVYSPQTAYADEDGLIDAPNVDLNEEVIDLKYAELAYKANAAVARVAIDIQDEILDRFDERV